MLWLCGGPPDGCESFRPVDRCQSVKVEISSVFAGEVVP